MRGRKIPTASIAKESHPRYPAHAGRERPSKTLGSETMDVMEVVGLVAVQVYEFNDGEDGRTYRWNATMGRLVAEGSGREPVTVDIREAGMDAETILRLNPDLDTDKALSLPLEALLCPLLFVEHREKQVLIDGWHRLFRAAWEGIDVLPAWILTQREADLIRQGGMG